VRRRHAFVGSDIAQRPLTAVAGLGQLSDGNGDLALLGQPAGRFAAGIYLGSHASSRVRSGSCGRRGGNAVIIGGKLCGGRGSWFFHETKDFDVRIRSSLTATSSPKRVAQYRESGAAFLAGD